MPNTCMTAGKLFRSWKYLRMQAKISADNDCLRFLQVTGGKLLHPQVIFVKTSLFLSGRLFSNLRTFFFSSVEQFDQCNHLLPLRSMVNPSKMIPFQKKLDCSLSAFQSVIRKNFSLKNFSTSPKRLGSGCCHFLTSFTFVSSEN